MTDFPICSVANCCNRVVGRGLCSMHWQRWRKGAALSAPKRTSREDTCSFIKYALESKTDNCVEWPYSRLPKGYGRIEENGRSAYAHRLVCIRAHGEPPQRGLQAAHYCGNPPCCNPRHIRWATQLENEADKVTHGTALRGEDRPGAKLTKDKVIEIRGIWPTLSQSQIASIYGISRGHVSGILSRRFWDHV